MRTFILFIAFVFSSAGFSDNDGIKVLTSKFDSPRLQKSLKFFVARYSSHATNHFYVGPTRIHKGKLSEALVYWKEGRTLLPYTELTRDEQELLAWHGHHLKLDRDTVDTQADIAGSTYLETHRYWIDLVEQCISLGEMHRISRSEALKSFPDEKRKSSTLGREPETACETDSDCLAGPELPTCFRYCKEEECRGRDIKLCQVYSKKQQGYIFPQCTVSVPCKKPVEIGCFNGQCGGI